MSIKKPSDFFKIKEEEEKITVDKSIRKLVKSEDLENFSTTFDYFKSFSETLNEYRGNIDKVNFLSEKVESIQSEIQNLLKREDFEDAILSQLCLFDQVVKDFQEKVKGINQKNLTEIRHDVGTLTQSVNEFLDNEVPKYKEVIEGIDEFVEQKYEDLAEALDDINEKNFSIILDEVKTLEESISRVNVREVEKLQSKVETDLREYNIHKEQLDKKLIDLEVQIVRNESHIRTQNQYVENIQEEVYKDVISKIPIQELDKRSRKLTEKIKYLEEIFEKFNEREILTETIVVEPPSTKNEDPITPLDQNFVTLDQLQQHYRIFINRIQQQLATLGGGGETRLKYLDDIVGIATNASAYDNKFLKYNHSIGKFEFVTVSGGGGGSQTLDDTLQLGNSSSLGMNIGVTTVTSLNIDSVTNFDTNSITFGSSSSTEIYSFPISQYRSARVQVQITQGTDYQTSDLLLIHNGTTSSLVEYASISTNDYLGTFESIISGGNVSLRLLMISGSSTTVKVASQLITL